MRGYTTIIGSDIATAKLFLEEGDVIGIPTETVYGLAGNALNESAVLKIFEVKQRPFFDPLIVHTHSIDEIGKYVTEIPAKAQMLIERFMPGPLTILLKKRSLIPDLVTSGLDTVGIRIPSHPLTLQLLKQIPFPLAAPSANPFGYISPTAAQHVLDQLNGKIPYILEGGPSNIGLESTIIGFEDEEAIIYRLGGLDLDEIEKVIGRVRVNINDSSNPRSPGLLKSHYAPKKPLLFGKAETILTVNAEAIKSKQVGVIAFNKQLEGINTDHQILLSPTGNLNEAAKNLFAALRKLDNGDVAIILATAFPATGLGLAINDRLRRAAAIA
jgi:L-threonylcarbamoyladenylate synthase